MSGASDVISAALDGCLPPADAMVQNAGGGAAEDAALAEQPGVA
jgi:hypothetical protein